MRVRKIAKQLKRFYGGMSYDSSMDEPVITYRIRNHAVKEHYIMRMTRKNYFGLINRKGNSQMMQNLYIHNSNSPYLFDEILEFWGYKED